MVYYFTSSDPRYVVYMGKDKHENEHLIKHGWPEDVWFHADKLSSAHVYLRLPEGSTLAQVPATVLDECCQLTKANSIKGSKLNHIGVQYTPWANLLKTGDMEVGAVTFKSRKKVTSVKTTKNSAVVNRISKTKTERVGEDLGAARRKRDVRVRRRDAAAKREALAQPDDQSDEEEQISFANVMREENMVKNTSMNKTYKEYEDDFM